ncbi:hypothetical protein FSP39_000468 [Pinctada imbricata]|uniref:Thioredoxin domain-containing protein n=1 Tax=Pinctada imbricata TaxID=66713 RepID=A0AA88XP45_PINIB|nr:hypothetical protein FSP39_000468 [Pinctada imbricata]
MTDDQEFNLTDLLKDKFFLTKEFFEKPEVVEEEPDDFEYSKNQNKEPVVKKLVDPNRGKVEALPAIQNRVIGLYFSAGWCPPCQQFTPLLKSLHEELEERKCPFQVVFISFDKTENDMEEYFTEKHGDWLAIPFKDPLIEELKSRYEVNAVPKLIIVQEDGEVITTKGRKEVQDRGYLSYRTWRQNVNLVEGGTLNPQRKDKNSEQSTENVTG